ncbi:DUF6332 family protein [Streptomyces sp. NPDC091377]|uniref:DUF6332 family protein n=1 Tax=unclassified Streptomyces TaxID=2593676 RepID=UPI003817E499
MSTYEGERSRGDRDARTVEIGYALVSGVFAAALLFGAVAGPALLLDLHGTLESGLRIAGLVLAPLLFTVRVVSVLQKFERSRQPSQPGRTSPDS